jgi:hypothetical protein
MVPVHLPFQHTFLLFLSLPTHHVSVFCLLKIPGPKISRSV